MAIEDLLKANIDGFIGYKFGASSPMKFNIGSPAEWHWTPRRGLDSEKSPYSPRHAPIREPIVCFYDHLQLLGVINLLGQSRHCRSHTRNGCLQGVRSPPAESYYHE